MIRYQLKCNRDHTFEAWFSNSTCYDKQVDLKLVVCPQCGSSKVSKAIMAPNIGTKNNRKSQVPIAPPKPASQDVAVQQTLPPTTQTQPGDLSTSPSHREVVAVMKKMREIVEKNAEYVGSRFAEEARKIHYNEMEEKSIYGEASRNDIEELLDEGVEIQPLPVLPEDHN